MKKSVLLFHIIKERFIFSTINSIINQTYKNFEIILIDDELTKKSEKKLLEIKSLDQRIFVYKNKINTGQVKQEILLFNFVLVTIFSFVMRMIFGRKIK